MGFSVKFAHTLHNYMILILGCNIKTLKDDLLSNFGPNVTFTKCPFTFEKVSIIDFQFTILVEQY